MQQFKMRGQAITGPVRYRENFCPEQLLRQKVSIQETAERVGYESASGFIRAYKRVKNCSPQHTQSTNCLM